VVPLGVGRSLSSVDNIGCLHYQFPDDRFGGIRLESGEQATSLTPTWLNKTPQQIHVSEVPIPTRNFMNTSQETFATDITSQLSKDTGCGAQPVVGRQHRMPALPIP
jgi:hypothetical protein